MNKHGLTWWAKVITAAVAALCGSAIAIRWFFWSGEQPPLAPPPGVVLPNVREPAPAETVPSTCSTPTGQGAAVPGGHG